MLPGAGPVLRPLSTLAIVAIERTLLPLRARRVDLAAVVARPLVRIGQQGVGGGDLLEAPLGLRFARVQVGVVLLRQRPEENTSELQSLMRISYAVFCLKK